MSMETSSINVERGMSGHESHTARMTGDQQRLKRSAAVVIQADKGFIQRQYRGLERKHHMEKHSPFPAEGKITEGDRADGVQTEWIEHGKHIFRCRDMMEHLIKPDGVLHARPFVV